MALTLVGLRAQFQTSIFGQRLALDKNDMLMGPKSMRLQIHDATSDTTGTQIPGYGYASVETTTDDSWNLENPIPGNQVTLFTQTTSTGIRTVKSTAALIVTTAGAAGSTLILTERGAFITLLAVTTALWKEINRSSTLCAFASS